MSVETILRLTPAVLGSTVFSIAGLCAAHGDEREALLPRPDLEKVEDIARVSRTLPQGRKLMSLGGDDYVVVEKIR